MVSQRPFTSLKRGRRTAGRPIPPVLLEFYAKNEGVGLGSTPDRIVRLCRLAEVWRVKWCDLHIVGDEPCEGWEDFRAFRVGRSQFGDEIVLVSSAPCCSSGAVLMLGVDVPGPGGIGPSPLEPSLVLARSFSEWLAHLRRYQWIEYGVIPGTVNELPKKLEPNCGNTISL